MNTSVVLMWAVVTVSGFQFNKEGEVDARTSWAETYRTEEECKQKTKEKNELFSMFKMSHRIAYCLSVKVDRTVR